MTKATHVALVSGGMDSTVAADVAVRWGPCDLLIYLDTGTGLSKNLRYVQKLADWIGVQLWTMRTEKSYIESVRENGFPGASQHTVMYASLKFRQISRLAGRVDELHCWTGVRRQESDRRMSTIEDKSEGDGGRWMWHAPIANWSKQECRNYIKRYEIICNPLWDELNRSGDCYCGAYADGPSEKVETLAAGCPGRVAWLDALEHQSNQGNEYDKWAHSGLSRNEIRAIRNDEDDDQMTLCSTCGIDID